MRLAVGRTTTHDLAEAERLCDRIAIVGLNGSGKTTLLRQLTGVTISEGAGGGESGGVVRRGRGARFVVLDQDAALPGTTVGEAITAAR